MNDSLWSLVISSAENFVLINGALSVVAFLVAALVRRRARFNNRHPLSLCRIYAAGLMIPPFVSAWLVIASLLPAFWLGPERWIAEHNEPHTVHLLNSLTIHLDPTLGYAALAFAVLAALAAAYAAAVGYLRIGRVIRQLDIGADPAAPDRIKQVEDACRRRHIDVGLVVSSYPFSFVWGYLRSKLIVSTGLLNALSAEELSALLEHEAAHHTRRDNLLKLMLTFCRYASPAFALNGLIYRWWSEQVEMVCDEVAARHTGAPLEVAGALVRLKRLTLNGEFMTAQPAESAFFGGHGQDFERRVLRVISLGEEDEKEAPSVLSRSWMKVAGIAGVSFALTLAALFAISPLAVHRVIEILLRAF